MPRAAADILHFHGKVVMEDGTPPGRLVGIQRTCEGANPLREGNTGKKGDYYIRLYIGDSGAVLSGAGNFAEMLVCYLEAVTPGYQSTRIDLSDRRILANPQLPTMVLSRAPPGALVDLRRNPVAPAGARSAWDRALKSLAANQWAAAETALRETVAAAPSFRPAWPALAVAYQNQQKNEDARQALTRAIALDPKPLPPYLALSAILLQLKDWPAAEKTAENLIAADPERIYLEAYLDSAIARFQQHDFDGSLRRLNDLIVLDRRGQIERAEYILGIVYEAKGDLKAAGEHLRRYLAEHPRTNDTSAAAARLANLGKRPATDVTTVIAASESRLPMSGEAPVPGGIRAFSRIALMPEGATYADFFLRYCRALVASRPPAASPTAEVSADIRAFVSTMEKLERLGDREGDRIIVRLAIDTAEGRRKTAEILALLGWRLTETRGGYDIELGDQPVDGPRQRIPGAFGIDELEMRDAIAAGRPFQFEIPVETAKLVGGAVWSTTLKDHPDSPYGPIDIFLRDPRFARLYSAVGAMENETAAAIVSAFGFEPLIRDYSARLAAFSDAISLTGNRMAVPGGQPAEKVWADLAGASPADPTAFLRALIEKDQGVLLAFYYDLSRADAAHQRYFTESPQRAKAFYRWYVDSVSLSTPERNRWQADILQKLSIEGGSEATDQRLLELPSLEPVAAGILLEERRGERLDPESAALLTRYYAQWRSLFPYFEKLPGLAAPQFQALAAFTERLDSATAAQREQWIGEWHSTVDLLVLGSEAGSLDAAKAATAFTAICDAFRDGAFSTRVLGVIRQLSGGAEIDGWIPAGLLRLSGARRASFERMKQLQNVPHIGDLGPVPDAAKTLLALTGAVYATLLEPAMLLPAEDSSLLARHDFVPSAHRRQWFSESQLSVSTAAPGSRFTGGFAQFREVAARLSERTAAVQPVASETSDSVTPSGIGATAAAAPVEATVPAAIFRADARIVEIYAAVTDSRGRYVDGLQKSDFAVRVENRPTDLFAFENQTANVSVALLFDTTGSMNATLPSLKRAALALVDHLRAGDAAAVYGFNDKVTEFQPFTTDKAALKRAILRAHAAGTTALYDALVRVNRDLAQCRGKKVTIVFTDGDDNASLFPADAAIQRAKARGIPIYTIAQGEALLRPRFVAQLANLSQSTGGSTFAIRKMQDIENAFQKMSEDLMHGYLLAVQPPLDDGYAWHKVSVALPQRKGLIVRAREGYLSGN